MREKEILSRENPSVKRYVALAASRGERRKQGLFVTEGIKLTQEALPYAVSALIAADGSAVLIETDGGKTAYTVEHT